jgi:hypothetical protein
VTILRFQIQHSGGRVESINVEAERALIGSGAHCEIRLPIDQSSIEHVLIQAGGGNVFAQALTFQPPPTINNVPFTQAPLPADGVLGIGQTQILVSASDEVGAGNVVKGQKKKSNPMVLVLGVLAIGGLLYAANQPAAGDDIGAAPKEPALFGPVVESCDQAGAQALARAREKHTQAEQKRERRAFHVQDGVHAVPLYEEASACYRKGGDARTANETIDIANSLRRELEDDYRTHRMRLEHSMTVNDDATARKQVRTLLNFTEGKSGPYVDWLSALERKYKLKLGRES